MRKAYSAILGVLAAVYWLTPLAAAPASGLPRGASELPACRIQIALSPDKHFAVYVQAAPGAKISTGLGDADPNQLWLLDTKTRLKTRLVVSKNNDDMKQVLGGLQSPVFSVDGREVYFLSSAWATSDAVHAVTIKTRKIRFVTDGSSLRVITQGSYRGDLVVNKHKYRPNGSGSYDADWLVSPSGREIQVWQ